MLTLLGCRGGEEVMLDVAGQDATEAFEDVGHSDEAREILDGLKVGTLKRQVRLSPSHPPNTHTPHILSHTDVNCVLQEGDPKPKVGNTTTTTATKTDGGLGLGVYAIILVGGLAAFFAYQYIGKS